MQRARDVGDKGLGKLDVGEVLGNAVLEKSLHLRCGFGSGIDATLRISQDDDFVDGVVEASKDEHDDSGAPQHALEF